MTVLLDSTVLIDALRKESGSVASLRKMLRSGDSLATSVINVGEIYSGARAHELNAVGELLQGIDAYPVSYTIAKRAGELRNRAARRGQTLELDDMLIAATALEMGISLWTDNIKDFKDTGVRFYRC